MAVTPNQLIQDPVAWPWPGGRWRALALHHERTVPRSRLADARTVTFVTVEAVVLAVLVSVGAGLGSIGAAGARPGTGPVSAPAIERVVDAPVGDGTTGTSGRIDPELPGPLLPPVPLPQP